jgi:hypothetical protein
MIPFDPSQAKHGVILRGIDPASLLSNKTVLEEWRINLQRQLIATGIRRHTLIQVNLDGIIIQGNHGARAAAEAGVPIEVRVIDLPHPSTGPILSIPIVKW